LPRLPLLHMFIRNRGASRDLLGDTDLEAVVSLVKAAAAVFAAIVGEVAAFSIAEVASSLTIHNRITRRVVLEVVLLTVSANVRRIVGLFFYRLMGATDKRQDQDETE
jgi:hypothetical protein